MDVLQREYLKVPEVAEVLRISQPGPTSRWGK